MRYTARQIEDAARHFLTASGSDEYEADIVARHMLEANLRGHDSHGIGMTAMYADYLKKGQLKPNTPPTIEQDRGAVLQFNGNLGYGQRAGYEATKIAIERAKETGVCLYTIKHSCHLGRIGTYGEQAAAAGMVSIHFVNVNQYDPLVAPYCGSAARFGTNPFCCAMPATDKHGPFILDFATSIVAMGKTRVAYLAKKHFDEPVMLTTEGIPTTDPSVMWHQPRGALMAFAKHKGSGLAFACELMAGLLSGGGTIQPGHSRDGSIVNNMTAFVIDPAVLTDMDFLKNEMDAMIDYVKSSPAPDPVNHPVLSPGESERVRREDRLAHGVEISEGEALAIRRAAEGFGVPEEHLLPMPC